MTAYLLLFRNASAADGYLATSEDMAQDLPKWQAWMGHMAQQGKLLHTAPIHYQGSLVQQDQSIEQQPYKEASSVLVTGFVLCQSDDLAEVERWGQTCPILKYPQSSVEIRPLIPFTT
ncbi:MAG: hypothetical protein JST78_08995 [Bacteroidetes bacterium]|nr:hypothetical protein [Bacteroidota bacterium]